jgi:hypothetical protein
MNNLFVFAIGGTGSRVVKALTFLLASGLRLPNTKAVIPIIIDPDAANGDLSRTVEILELYKEIRRKGISDGSQFFGTRVCSLFDLEATEEMEESGEYVFEIEGVKDSRFKEFIGYNELDRQNKAMMSLLFSDENLETQMEVGFKGNPNIGSVVLNKFSRTKLFEKFASVFNENDRIFIISSIFGGTGAAGFPLILKNIRSASAGVPRAGFLKQSKIGALTVLPYFCVDRNEQTSIDSNTFMSKTKAALSYYSKNVSGNNSLNALYYIGDDTLNSQCGADGAAEQKNRAHFVELAGALAIQNFMCFTDEELEVKNGRAVEARYFEYGLHQETGKIRFTDLGKGTQELINKPLTQYCLFKNYLQYHFDEFQDDAWAKNGRHKLIRMQLDANWMLWLEEFNGHFNEWLNEMTSSQVSFHPFVTSRHGKEILNLVVDRPGKKKLLGVNSIEYYRKMLNKREPAFDRLESGSQKLLALFSHVTEDIIESRINL